MNPKLNPTVSVVRLSDSILEFFKSCARQQVRIRVQNDLIFGIVNHLDGSKSMTELARMYSVEENALTNLLVYLQKNGLLDVVGEGNDIEKYEKYRRVIHFLAEYAESREDLVQMWNRIRSSSVLIIGLGAVGTWVACNLVQSGVESLILMDKDAVDQTNLHRQFGYTREDIGRLKVDVIEERLKQYEPSASVQKVYSFLDASALDVFYDKKIDLIINCADKPTVDQTSLWVGEYAMKRSVPHIIGGGYNLHLSLIGQTVIPNQTACVKSYQKSLEEENRIDATKLKKLAVRNRKIGSFTPLCSINASMIGMEALKILTRKIAPANVNRRGEMDVFSMRIHYTDYEKRDDCEWCGIHGKYRRS